MSEAQGASLAKDAWIRLRSNRMALVSLIILAIIVSFSFIGPFFCEYKYDEQNLDEQFLGPNQQHWFGTDSLGRDLFARTSYGGRISLAVGFLATTVSLLIGVSYGMVAGYVGGENRCHFNAYRGYTLFPPFHHFCYLTNGTFWKKFPPSFSCNWSGGMADHGSDNPGSNLKFKTGRVY